jgi:hypothetical protein
MCERAWLCGQGSCLLAGLSHETVGREIRGHAMKPCLALAIAGTALMLTAPAQAQLVSEMFEDVGSCYSRSYDVAHLDSHPLQQVEKIALWSTDEYEDPKYEQVLQLYFRLRNGTDYSGYAYCSNALCQMEADGGSFTLSRARTGLQLNVGKFLEVEGVDSFSGNLADSDDKAFLMYPVRPAECS